jgi:pimeloyl-ACP methyl ester carboxylesterase
MEDFVKQVVKDHDAVLVGLSSGGGFALRVAASSRQKLFARYILLSPYTGYDSPTVKPNSGGWVNVSTLRIIGLSLLGPIGEKLFGDLPVIRYAIDPRMAQYLTAYYSFRLLKNFAPHFDYRSDIAAVKQPLQVLVGEKDELFNPYAFHKLFTEIKPDTKVTLIPGVGHITLTTDKKGMAAILKALQIP